MSELPDWTPAYQRIVESNANCPSLRVLANDAAQAVAARYGLPQGVTPNYEQKAYILNDPTEGLFIPPMVWCQLEDFSDNCVCVCLASEAYDTDGYINDLSQFKKELGL